MTNAVSFLQNLYTVNHLLFALKILLVVAVLMPLVLILLDYLDYRRLKNIKLAFLEITPPQSSTKTSHANGQLFAVLHGLYSIRSFKAQLLRQRQTISLEVVSSREDGIRYIAGVPEDSISTFEQTVISYLPNVRFSEILDYIPAGTSDSHYSRLLEFKLWRHFVRPLRSHDALAQHDPIAFLTGSLTKPKPGEMLVLQMVLSPAHSREAIRIHNKLMVGKEPELFEYTWMLPFRLLLKIVGVLMGILGFLLEAIGDIFDPSDYRAHKSNRYQPPKTQALQAIHEKMLSKVQQPLFRADIRAYFVTSDSQRMQERTNGLIGSLATFHEPGHQALILRRNFLLSRIRSLQQFKQFKFTNRLPSVLPASSSLLSVEEVANLYHFPYGQSTAENMARSFSKTLAAPAAIKKRADNGGFDIVVGVNRHHGTETPIGLTTSERDRHMFIVGGTGSGKTTLLKYQVVQDIQNGKGVAVIDPHGDLAEELLEFIPEERKEDLIYLDPDDLDHPIGVNLLELPKGLEGNALLREKDRVTESVVSVMRKIFSDDDSGGHRVEYILRNTVQTALTLDNPTLFTIFRLLNDGKFAKQAIKNLEDENLKMFWKDELGKAGSYQKVKMAAGITSKVGRFLFSASARAMLGQEKSTIDFNEILDGKILICNFSKGKLGEDTSMLFGITILAKLQLAALKRSERKQSERKPFYLYVDEFQSFATLSFTQMLSEARKYKVFLTMAEQSTQQQDDQKLVNIILANVGTVVAFRTGSPRDEDLLLPLFEPYVEKREISNLPAYNFYIRIQGKDSSEPMSGETIVV